jgi:flagellar FliL protein
MLDEPEQTDSDAEEKAPDNGKPEPDKPEGAADETDIKQVIEMQPFIVNLADKNESRYLRMSISLGVGGGDDAKVDSLFTTKIRNGILAIVTTKTSDQVLTVEGKDQLRKEMLKAARAAANKPEVLSIYITDFIVQM